MYLLCRTIYTKTIFFEVVKVLYIYIYGIYIPCLLTLRRLSQRGKAKQFLFDTLTRELEQCVRRLAYVILSAFNKLKVDHPQVICVQQFS